MLFACHESYKIASRLYTRAFSRRGESFPETYFDFENDILFMDARVSWFKDILKDMDKDITKVSNLALRVEFSPSEKLQGCPDEQTYKWIAEVLSIFNNIKNLTFVLEQETHHCRSPCLYCAGCLPWSKEQEADLVFADDLYTVQRALSIYDGDETLSFDSYANMSVDSSQLRRYQFSLGKKRRQKFIIPKIEMKIVVTAKLQKLLKSKKEEYINNQLGAMDGEASRIAELGDTEE